MWLTAGYCGGSIHAPAVCGETAKSPSFCVGPSPAGLTWTHTVNIPARRALTPPLTPSPPLTRWHFAFSHSSVRSCCPFPSAASIKMQRTPITAAVPNAGPGQLPLSKPTHAGLYLKDSPLQISAAFRWKLASLAVEMMAANIKCKKTLKGLKTHLGFELQAWISSCRDRRRFKEQPLGFFFKSF